MMTDTTKSFLNDVKKIVNKNNNHEMLYARKAGTTDSNGIYWRRDRVVTIKTGSPNAIASIEFSKNVSNDHTSASTNVNNPSIDNLNWSDSQIKTGDSTHKCAFYREGTTNDSSGDLVITITLTGDDTTNGFYYDHSNPFSTEYFETMVDDANSFYINIGNKSTKKVYRKLELHLKPNKTINSDLLVNLPVTMYKAIYMYSSFFSPFVVYLNGTIKDKENSIIKEYDYEIINSKRTSSICVLVDQEVIVDLHLYSSLRGINDDLTSKISSTELDKTVIPVIPPISSYNEWFGVISSLLESSNENIDISYVPVTKGEIVENNVYFLTGNKQADLTTDGAKICSLRCLIVSQQIYVDKLENNLKWASGDYNSVCDYDLICVEGETSTTANITGTNWDSNNYTYIYHTSRLVGKENDKPYIALKVSDPTTDGVDDGIDTSIDTTSYDYYNIINGISLTGDQYMELYNSNSKYQMFLATFEDYTKSSEAKIERKSYKINFVLNKNGFTFDCFNWDSASIDVKYGDKVEYEIQKDSGTSENRFITSTDDTKDVFFKIKVTKWFDYSQERASNIFMIKSYNTSSNNLGDFELTNSLTLDSDNLITGTGSLTMKALDYARAKLTTVKFTYNKIKEMRISPWIANTTPVFPTANTTTRFGRTSGTTITTEDTWITYMSDLNDSDNVYLWIKSSDDTYGGITRWLYFSNEFFSSNNLYNPSRSYYVNGLSANVVPCIITRGGNTELWFLTTISGGGGHTTRIISAPKITDPNDSSVKYDPIDFYIKINTLECYSYSVDEDTYYGIRLGASSPSSNSNTAVADISPLANTSTYENRRLYDSNVYWSCSQDTEAGESIQISRYLYQYEDLNKTQPSGKKIAYYLRLPSSVTNDQYGSKFEMFKNWGNGAARLYREGLYPEDGKDHTITISFAVVLPKYVSSNYYPTNNYLTSSFTRVIAGNIYNKSYDSSNGFNCAYLFIDDPSSSTNPISSRLKDCQFNDLINGGYLDKKPKYTSSNALQYTIAPPWRFSSNN